MGVCFRASNEVLPRGGSCSAIISAACHGPVGDVDAAFEPVQWGELRSVPLLDRHEPQNTDAYQQDAEHICGDTVFEVMDSNQPGHCCFTTYDVAHPTTNRCYC